MIYFTSDTHFGHANIIQYCSRPFTDVDHMNETLVQNWNARVGPDDLVYHLGDFCMGNKKINAPIRRRLNGKVIIVKGNHDPKDEVLRDAGFDEIHTRLEIEVDGYKLYLAHIPMHLDPGERYYPPELKTEAPVYYDYFLCGHVHTSWKRQGKTINVGVDVSDFKPLTLAELIARDDA